MILKNDDTGRRERGERLAELLRKLYAAGYRMTEQRRAILEALVYSDRHPGAEDLYEEVRAAHPSLSRATVYKTLEMLKSVSEVLELEFRDASAGNRYDGVRAYSHPHLVCEQCGAIEDVLADPFAHSLESIAQEMGYQVDRYRLDLYGRCPRCRVDGDAGGASPIGR